MILMMVDQKRKWNQKEKRRGEDQGPLRNHQRNPVKRNLKKNPAQRILQVIQINFGWVDCCFHNEIRFSYKIFGNRFPFLFRAYQPVQPWPDAEKMTSMHMLLTSKHMLHQLKPTNNRPAVVWIYIYRQKVYLSIMKIKINIHGIRYWCTVRENEYL